MVQRTYGAMTNDVLISIPLFVLMGYVMERGALVDKMFYAIQLAFRRVPASLAVATLIVCTFWGIASGPGRRGRGADGRDRVQPDAKAGYDVRLASGVITAGGTLGILIPPSVMIIVYAAVAGQSVVKLYAAAMFPGFFLALLYLIYIVGWALIDPKIAPKLPESETRVPVRPWVAELQQAYSRNMLPALLAAVLAPGRAMEITRGRRAHRLPDAAEESRLRAGPAGADTGDAVGHLVVRRHPPAGRTSSRLPRHRRCRRWTTRRSSSAPAPLPSPRKKSWRNSAAPPAAPGPRGKNEPETLQQMGSAELRNQARAAPSKSGPPPEFYTYFAIVAGILGLLLLYYYWIMEAEQFEVLRLLISSVMPLGILTVVVLAVILFGITTATESAAVGAAGAFLLAFQARTLDWKRTKEAVFLTAKTTSMVCWLFVGSALFSAVFAHPRRPGAARELGAVAQHDAGPVHDPVAGDHLHPRLAAGMDRDHRDLRADLPADAEALQHRPDPVGRRWCS